MAELSVSRKSVSSLLSGDEIRNRKYIIPNFQRSYRWEVDKCEIFWDDIVQFAGEILHNIESEKEYFLGTIVTYADDRKNQYIVDGQQRLTSFLLILRAFYKKLEDIPDNNQDNAVKGLMAQIKPCIWDIDGVSLEIKSVEEVRMKSEVQTDIERRVFNQILSRGTVNENDDDNYAKNYKYFSDRISEFAVTNPMNWNNLCVIILRKCILLPIECQNEDVALTIFGTLNDRGLQLDDSDIFKSNLIKIIRRNHENRDQVEEKFHENWSVLTEICNYLNKFKEIGVNDVFRYYSHVIRAEKNINDREVGLRKFYSENDFRYFNEKTPLSLMSDLVSIAEFWRFLMDYEIMDAEIDDQTIRVNEKTKQLIHVLSYYSNELWRYPVTVFYNKHKDLEDFQDKIEYFVEKLLSFFYYKYLVEEARRDNIRDTVYKLCSSIHLNENSEDGFNPSLISVTDFVDFDGFKAKISGRKLAPKITKPLLLLEAYLYGQEGIISRFEIEHIFPKRWTTANYNGWNSADAEEFLEKIGNKIVIGKKQNLQAANNFFARKKEIYRNNRENQRIHVLEKLWNYDKESWEKEDITQREEDLARIFWEYFRTNIHVDTN